MAGARAIFVHMTQYTKYVLGRPMQRKGKKIHTYIHATPLPHTHTSTIHTHILLSRGHPQSVMNFQDPN